MPLTAFGFLNMALPDVLDILLVGILIYLAFKFIRGSAAMNIFVAILLLFMFRIVVEALGMRLMSSILGTVLDVGVVALIVIFQPEVRHFLIRLGQNGVMRNSQFLSRLFGERGRSMNSEVVNEITEACRTMGEDKTGALIVLPHKNPLQYIIETGDRIDALVNRRLIMNLFFKNSPLHDGAMIINGSRIVAARCTLPITGRTDIPPSYGMRHKAAIGITEESDADVIVVSEETGGISFVHGGQLQHIGNINELKLLLSPSEEKS